MTFHHTPFDRRDDRAVRLQAERKLRDMPLVQIDRPQMAWREIVNGVLVTALLCCSIYGLLVIV